MRHRNSTENSCFILIFHFVSNPQPIKGTSISGVSCQLWTPKTSCTTLGELLWKLEGLGCPLDRTFPADANTEGHSGWENVFGWPHYHADHPVQLSWLFQFQYLSQSMHAWCAEEAAIAQKKKKRPTSCGNDLVVVILFHTDQKNFY